jgi:hypothetical protein
MAKTVKKTRIEKKQNKKPNFNISTTNMKAEGRPLKDFKLTIKSEAKYRLFKIRFNLKDDDLITKEEFYAKKKEMYGE